MAEDHRNAPRVKIQIKITYDTYAGGVKHAKAVLSRDLSSEGICFVTDEVLDPECHLELMMHLPGGIGTVACEAVVVWQREMDDPPEGHEGLAIETGVKIVVMESDGKAMLLQFIKDHGDTF